MLLYIGNEQYYILNVTEVYNSIQIYYALIVMEKL